MKLDPTKMKDWQVAEAAEENLKPAAELVEELGLKDDEWDAYGKYLAKVDVSKVLKRVGAGRKGKYIDVTAITPTALGEGKTTTTLGLVEGLGKLGKKSAVRRPDLQHQGIRRGRRPCAGHPAHLAFARPYG